MDKPDTILLSDVTWKEKLQKGEDVQNVGLIKTFIPEELRVEDGENGLPKVKFVISTSARDRHADTVSVKGWQLDNYRKNPVVLYGHHSAGLPIGQALDVNVSKGKLESTVQFDTDIVEHPLPRAVVALLKRGTLRAASVGFIPQEWKQPDPDTLEEHQKNRFPLDFTKQELVEWSVVPVPSNPEALMSAKKSGIDIAPIINWAGEILEMYGAAKQGLWIPRSILESVAKIGAPTIVGSPKDGWTIEPKKDPEEDKGVSPSSISNAKAPENTPWNGPSLSDFTSKNWDELSDSEKSSIAKHFAWAESMPPSSYGGLKLPHHSASNGNTVWNGVRAAMGALMGARGGVNIPSADKAAVHAHLAGHYKAFGKEPPAMKDYTEEELRELFEDDELEFDKEGLEEEEKADGFKIQTLILPKNLWESVDAAKKWVSDHGYKTKMDETDTSYHFRQEDPGMFQQLRTICINPRRSAPMDKCKVKAVGGPMKAAEDSEQKDETPFSPKDVAFAFDRIQKFDRTPSTRLFVIQDGFAEELSGMFERTTEKDSWALLIRNGDEKSNGGWFVPIQQEMERNEVLDFAMRTLEEKNDIEVSIALHCGDDDKKRPVYLEQVKVCRKQVNEKPNPVVKQEPVAGMKDVIEAMGASLGPAIKKALNEVMGRIED